MERPYSDSDYVTNKSLAVPLPSNKPLAVSLPFSNPLAVPLPLDNPPSEPLCAASHISCNGARTIDGLGHCLTHPIFI